MNQLTGAILLAVLAAAIKFIFDGWTSRKANRLKRIDRQLEFFYGPLLALTHASEQAWKSFRSIHRTENGPYWGVPNDPPTEAEALAWRMWIEKVFMPLNERVENLIVEHADLLEEECIPSVLLHLCAHVEAYRGVVAQWKSDDFSRQWSTINYPCPELREYAQRHYTALKKRQAALIRAGA